MVRISRTWGVKDRVRLVATWMLLGSARVVIAILPFRLIRGFLGEHHATTMTGEPSLAGHRHARARHVATLIGIAAAHSPWRADCYPQALTARLMLTMARIPHTVRFGVRRDGDELRAHAWVLAGDVMVTGGDGGDYTAVAAFTWTPRRDRL